MCKIIPKQEFINLFNNMKNCEYTTVVLLDIDNSKVSLGYSITDKVIDIIYKNLKMFEGEYISMVGRDCFGVAILKSQVDVFDLVNKKNEVQKEINKSINKDLTFCMGVAMCNDKLKQPDELITLASEALLAAKKKGLNSIELAIQENMERKNYYFRKSQIQRLANYCSKHDKSEAEVVRKALDFFLDQEVFD